MLFIMYENKREKHAIRKFSVGTASIVIGGLIYGFMGDNEAQASETSFNNLGENKVEFNAQNPQAPQQTYTEVTNKEQASGSKALENHSSQSEEVIKTEGVENEQTKSKSSSVEENTVTETQQQDAVKNEERSSEIIQKHKNESVEMPPKTKLYRAIQPATSGDQDVRTKNENTTVGKDVSSQVIVENGEITGFNNGNNIHPHHGQGGRLNYKLKFPDKVNSGDTFKIQLSENVNTHGISVERNAPNIMTKNEQGKEDIIAEGNVSQDGHTITYTFKDYVKGKQNLTADLSISYFTNPENIKNSGKQLITSTIGTKTTSSDIYIHYDNSDYVDGRISELNTKEGKFKQIAYINPYGYLNWGDTISVSGDVVRGASKVSTNPKVSIYKYKGQGNPPASIYLEPDMWEVVDKDNSSINYYNGGYSLNLDVNNGQKYAINYEGFYDSKAPELLYRTYIQTGDYYYYPFSKQKINGVKLYENNASGNGELRPVPPVQPDSIPEVHNNLVETTEDSNVIDISWDTALDEENGENKGPQEEITENNNVEVIEESNLIENTEDTALDEENGENRGPQEEVTENKDVEVMEEHNLIENTEDTMTEEESGQNGSSQEEVEERQIIDILEDTTPEGESGQNEGNQEEIEEHQIIDIIEDTTPEGESGQNEGSQEEVEENQIIDIIEDTTPEGESGQNGGNQEEVEEHQIIDIIEDTTPEGESGQNGGNQEEIEEHQIIDIIADTTPEGESGQNEGNQEEIEEHQIIDIIEDTTPEGESGQNEGNQEEIEEHQVIDRVGGKAPERKGGQIERNQEKIEEHPINAPVIHVSTSMHKNANSKSVKVLPSTGEAHKNTPTLAILLTVIGSVLLFRRKSKFNKAK